MSHIHRISALFLTLAAGLALAMTVISAAAGPSGGATLYVAPTSSGSGDCSSWADACTLQTALASADSGDQIWVKAGLHKPGDYMTNTFSLVNGVVVYGGFDGTESMLDQRDWETHLTILSGDIDNNDLTNPNGVVTHTAYIIGDNSYHVISSTGVLSDTVLDGFIITAGQANGAYPNGNGGGMYNDGSNPTVVNVTFSGNFAGHGGGIYNNGNSSLTLTNVIFSGNLATFGGGMSSEGANGNNPTLTNVTFSGNHGYFGGGMYNFDSSPTLMNVTFSDNGAYAGGGIHNSGNISNTSSSPTLTNVTFSSNSASIGGGMYTGRYSNLTLINVTFTSNSAQQEGGGMVNWGANTLLTNVTFSNNSANSGGGMRNEAYSSSTLTNVTFSSNFATNNGGGIYNNYLTSNLTLTNIIFWGNTAITGPQIYNEGIHTPIISYSDIQESGGSGSGWDSSLGNDGGGNIDADPLFVDAANGDLHLDLTSPAIDAGNNLSVTVTTDLDGNPRFVDIPTVPDTGNGTPPIVDIGAYEAYLIEYRIYLPLVVRTTP